MTKQSFTPPVVAVLGHVDHGKTSLLDAIRKTNIAAREHGGITQKIGASSIELLHEGEKRHITFIDTPGHQAFSQMRGRGVQAADIGLLIVSAVDGVMPQTRESIQLLQAAKTPFIVVLTKSDLPDRNPEKVKQQLLRENILLENYGGDVPVIEVSSRAGTNIKELLELILLVYEMKYSSTDKNLLPIASAEDLLKAVVIESKLDPKAGPRATAIVKSGTIAVKDELIADGKEARVRSLVTDAGASVQKATVGEAVEILGFKEVPAVGSIVYNEKQSQIEKSNVALEVKPQAGVGEAEAGTLSLILCADTQGSLEAIVAALPKEHLTVLIQKTGEVSEADVLFAKSTGAIVLTFNIKLKPDVIKFAFTEKVLIKNYTIIYELLDEVQEVIQGKQLALMEQIYGSAQILASFPFEKSKVLGIRVLDGRVARGDKVRLIRGEEIVGESTIVSVRHGREVTSKAEKGSEAGIMISPFLDFQVGDVILSHS